MGVMNLVKANLRKGKGTILSLFILIAASALLLNIGLTVITVMSSFYEHKSEELHDPHVIMVMEKSDYKQENLDFFKAYPGVNDVEFEPIMVMGSAFFRFGDSEFNSGLAILNADASRKLAPLKLVGKQEPIPGGEAVYLPYSFQASGGYQLGDTLTITYQNRSHSYQVAGFFESTMLGTNNMGVMKLYLADAAYRQLSVKLGDKGSGVLLSATLADMKRSTEMLDEFHTKFMSTSSGVNDPFQYMADIEVMKQVSGMTVNLIAIILVVFAGVIVLVSLIVIKFRVSNMIEDSIVNIGVLKALGYTNRQIAAAQVGQFAFITLAASIVGVALSYAFFPVFSKILSTLTGLLWARTFNVTLNLASIFIVLVSVIVVALVSLGRIRKLQPVAALRGGITAHNFRRNYFRLEKARGGLQILHACKAAMMNSKQNIMITVIMIAITFASVFSIVLYDNIARDKTAFIRLIGSETSNVTIQTKEGADSAKLRSAVEQMDGVRKTLFLDTIPIKIEGLSIYTNISDDFSLLDNQTVYEGRYPKYDNEIAISWTLAKQTNKSIGDMINLEDNGTTFSYLVTGLSQSIGNMGQAAYMTTPGIKQLIPRYTGQYIDVYLDGVSNGAFINEVKARYGDQAAEVTDIDASIDSQSSIYTTAVFTVMVIVLVISALVILLILYLVIKTTLLKRKRDFGILKAIGYTTLQLMNQLAYSYVPVMLAGVMCGGLLGALYTNAMLTLLLSRAGIHNVQFTIKLSFIVALCIGMLMLAYIISMIAAYRMKRITPHGLITE
ncbi:ABC transporter permease [Paenibacillus sp. MMS18-CY102]|uniref:ABC transporter permease n=1 Tax=Paenibacillus sp. MMS18-CY102 TaxID=2682849 RepID=UPI00136679F6|nr:ABC transporter permease [Paenibacillus sp. MMS18-CY102]MWC30790.1 FtsX-like permease family protein [Paenibacillus sp. MMS18-CY102]